MKTILFIILISSVNLYSQTLVGYWPFTGNAGDSSGYGNHGYLVNGPVLANDRYSVSNRSYLFNGSNSYIEGGNTGINFPSGSTARTITAWIKSNNIPSEDRNILHFGGPGTAGNFHLFLGAPGKPWLGNGGGQGGITVEINLSDTTWHFLAGIYEGPGTNMLRIYIDGYLAAFGVSSFVPNTSLTFNWRIGRFQDNPGPAFTGRIDEVRLYTAGALTAAQVLTLYNQTTTSPNLISPPNGSTGTSLTPTLDWDSLVVSTNYRVQIATDSLISSPIWDTTVTRSQVNVRSGLLSNNVRYFWRVRNNVNTELCPWSLKWDFRTALVGINPVSNEIPKEFSLSQNYPNPFNPSTVIHFDIPKQSFTKLAVYDLLGREVATLVNQQLNAGRYEVTFDAGKFASGMYFYKLETEHFTDVKKMVLIK